MEVRVVFLKIGEIDTQKEKYTADVFLQAKWREPKLDGRVDTVCSPDPMNTLSTFHMCYF